MIMVRYGYFALLILGVGFAGATLADIPETDPVVVVDLATSAGARAAGATWRYADARLVETGFFAPGADGQPGSEGVDTMSLEPQAGAREFDDGAWPLVTPESLAQRRGHGRVSFNWYRLEIVVPESIDGVATAGTTAVLDVSLDDYAEVWVDGELPRAQGQAGGSVVAGWNGHNRLVVGRRLRPGRVIEVAIFGMNAPISNAPTNYIYVRSATLALHAAPPEPVAFEPHEVNLDVLRLDPAIDGLVPRNPKLWKLAEGFAFTEGPVWGPDGALYFSDPNDNRIYRLREREGAPVELEVFRDRSGYAGDDVALYPQPGSNGLAFDAEGRLTVDEHGNRRVTRLEHDGRITVLADRHRGARLNSPNDLVYRRDGTLYFTDPPFGLPGFFADPAKELAFSGIFRVVDGEVELLARDLEGPNGIAFSPDERFLYVSNWDSARKVVMRYPVTRDGRLRRGEVFFDMSTAPGDEALDGLKVDAAGNLYVSGPGGIWVLSAAGRHLGTLVLPRLAANFAWGGVDGRTLYITARDRVYRTTLLIGHAQPRATP
jgi:gluconolactonase